MKVLVVGGGGREHALCWAISRSALCDALICAPGNAGIARVAECVDAKADDLEAQVALARARAVDLVVVGPEAPLVAGLVDRLAEVGIAAFGPTAAAAALEGSKLFMKEMCGRHRIPTAGYRTFGGTDAAVDPNAMSRQAQMARTYVVEHGVPVVIKADGLAAGKGVTVATTVEEAERAIDEALIDRRFGAAGDSVLVEERLTGTELSFFALVDGEAARPFGTAKDFKRAFDGDRGPNTGGMGAVSPHPLATPELEARVMREIVEPLVRGMAAEGRPYRGVLYAGLMLTDDGPKLLEINVRFGDPECQALVVRLDSDLLAVLAAASGRGDAGTGKGGSALAEMDVRWRDAVAVCVVMANRGYPGEHARGGTIEGLDEAEALENVAVFHAGTISGADGATRATGGRVLNGVGSGSCTAAARAGAYAAVHRIRWADAVWREDIS